VGSIRSSNSCSRILLPGPASPTTDGCEWTRELAKTFGTNTVAVTPWAIVASPHGSGQIIGVCLDRNYFLSNYLKDASVGAIGRELEIEISSIPMPSKVQLIGQSELTAAGVPGTAGMTFNPLLHWQMDQLKTIIYYEEYPSETGLPGAKIHGFRFPVGARVATALATASGIERLNCGLLWKPLQCVTHISTYAITSNDYSTAGAAEGADMPVGAQTLFDGFVKLEVSRFGTNFVEIDGGAATPPTGLAWVCLGESQDALYGRAKSDNNVQAYAPLNLLLARASGVRQWHTQDNQTEAVWLAGIYTGSTSEFEVTITEGGAPLNNLMNGEAIYLAQTTAFRKVTVNPQGFATVEELAN